MTNTDLYVDDMVLFSNDNLSNYLKWKLMENFTLDFLGNAKRYLRMKLKRTTCLYP